MFDRWPHSERSKPGSVEHGNICFYRVRGKNVFYSSIVVKTSSMCVKIKNDSINML